MLVPLHPLLFQLLAYLLCMLVKHSELQSDPFGTGGKAASIAPVAAAVARGRSEEAAVHDLKEVGVPLRFSRAIFLSDTWCLRDWH